MVQVGPPGYVSSTLTGTTAHVPNFCMLSASVPRSATNTLRFSGSEASDTHTHDIVWVSICLRLRIFRNSDIGVLRVSPGLALGLDGNTLRVGDGCHAGCPRRCRVFLVVAFYAHTWQALLLDRVPEELQIGVYFEQLRQLLPGNNAPLWCWGLRHQKVRLTTKWNCPSTIQSGRNDKSH